MQFSVYRIPERPSPIVLLKIPILAGQQTVFLTDTWSRATDLRLADVFPQTESSRDGPSSRTAPHFFQSDGAPLSADAARLRSAARHDGTVNAKAEADKRARYPEHAAPSRLVPVA